MKVTLSFLVLLFISVTCLGQSISVLRGDEDEEPLKSFVVLADRNYSFEQVRTDKSLQFLTTSTLQGASAYWIRLVVSFPKADEQYLLKIKPNYLTRLYQLNPVTKQLINTPKKERLEPGWQSGRHFFKTGVNPDTLYLYLDVNTSHATRKSYEAEIKVSTIEAFQESRNQQQLVWLVGLAVVTMFFLHNLYFYITFRDRAVAYYLLIQLGGAIYLTAYWYKFDLWFPNSLFNFVLVNNVRTYDLNNLLAHVGIVTTFYGFVGFVRSYLDTKKNLRVQDVILKVLLWIYIVASVVIAAVNVFWFELEHLTVLYDNLYCAIIILAISYTCALGYLRGIPSSGALMLANIIQLVLMLLIPLYHLLIDTDGHRNYWTILIAALSQALLFSIALVNRTKLVQQELQAKELERKQLAFELREEAYQKRLRELEIVQMNNVLQSEKKQRVQLQSNFEMNQRELATSTLNTVQKNELLAELKQQLANIKHADRYHYKKGVDDMTAMLNDNLQLDKDWQNFKMHFEQVHPQFFEQLQKEHPTLTQKEIRLYLYLQMKLTHKEIAALFGIEQASVRRAKTRLLKKIGVKEKK